MEESVVRVLLPVVLAAIMLGMGLGLRAADFVRVAARPRVTLLGFALQLLFLPLLALAVIAVLPLDPVAAAGLFLVALCPGGATSNLFSYIARGDVALSITLTGVVSLLSPLTLPLAFLAYLHFGGVALEPFDLPLLPAMKQLALVTLLPISLGMTLRHVAPRWAAQAEPVVRRLSLLAMIGIVLLLMATNVQVVYGMLSLSAVAVLLLSSGSLGLAWLIAGHLRVDAATRRTLALEVGVQNAGTAMMVALAILGRPELAFVPLLYGLLMNVPAFAFVAWVQGEDRRVPGYPATVAPQRSSE